MRVSFDEFSAGGKVVSASAQSAQPSTGGGVFANSLSETGRDAADVFLNAGRRANEAGEGIVSNIQQGRPIGAVSKFIQGVGRVVGGTFLDTAKIPLSQGAEDKVAGVARDVGEAAMQTPPAQFLLERYQALSPEARRNVDDALGFAEGLAELGGIRGGSRVIGAGANVAQDVTAPIGRAASEVAQTVNTAARTGAQAIQPATDVVRGIGTQVTDFARRTGREAIDTAEESRRLATLPEPDARLIRTGADERVVNLVRNSTPQERNVYRDLVEAAKAKEGDLEAQQPKVIAGQEFMKPVDHLLKQRDTIGKQLGETRQSLSNSKNININPYFREFQRYLTEDLGLRIDNKGNLIKGEGRVADSDLKEIQKLYNDLRPETIGTNMKSQRWIDEYLQRTFKEYDLRQAREQTFSDDVTRVAEKARSSLRQAMPEEYNALSTQYATVMKPIQDVVKLLGYKGDLEELTTKDLKAAEVALRVLGNASDRPQSVIDEVLSVAQQTGYTSDVDLNRVLILTDQLEDLYDITPSRGFSGSAARGVNQSAAGTVGDAATGNISGLFSKALNSRASQKEVQEAFEAFLNSLD